MSLATFGADHGAGVTVSGHTLSFASSFESARATVGRSGGKLFAEFGPWTGSGDKLVGVGNASASVANYLGADANAWAYHKDGLKITNGNLSTPYGASWGNANVIGVLLEVNAGVGSLTFYKDGVSQGVAFNNLPADVYYPMACVFFGDATFNFGDSAFAFTQPEGSGLWSDTADIAGVAAFGFTCSGTLTGTADAPAVAEPAQGHGRGARLVSTSMPVDELLRRLERALEDERAAREAAVIVASQPEPAAESATRTTARRRRETEFLLLAA